jgi:photosystem II stability/assembly factor-like uncharacterized protein
LNKPPTVSLISPTSGTIVQKGVPVDLVAEASDPDGAVVSVEFFEGSTRLATVVTTPFQFRWIPVMDGTFSLTAIATDNSGAVVASDPVSLIVQTPGTSPSPTPPNLSPVVRITNPVDGSFFRQGDSITLSAEATDPDGDSVSVEYFDGTTSIGTATLIPFVVNWGTAAQGPHSIRAVATDALGAQTSSVPVSITVMPATVVPPPAVSMPTGSLNGVFFADDSRGWIVGDQGRIWTTGDGGRSWNGQFSGTSSLLTRVQFVGTSVGWAVGVNGTIVKTFDGGGRWAPLVSGTFETLRGLSFVSELIGWVVGDNNTILKTMDGGATWASQAPLPTNFWGAISFISPLKGWIGGTGEVLQTSDGGSTWIRQPAALSSPSIARNIGFSDARFVSETRGTMVGASRVGDILRTTADGGATWTTLENTAANTSMLGVASGDAGHLWAVGLFGVIAASTDGGITWILQPSPTGRSLNAVWAVSALGAWAVGENGAVIRTTNGGKTWLLLNGGT